MKHHEADVYHFPIQLFGELDFMWADKPNLSQLRYSNQIPSGSVIRKAMVEKVKFQQVKPEDWDFWLRSQKCGATFNFFNEIVYYYRMRKDSLWGSVPKNMDEIRAGVLKSYEEFEPVNIKQSLCVWIGYRLKIEQTDAKNLHHHLSVINQMSKDGTKFEEHILDYINNIKKK
jgi:hypothetical protein